MVCPVHNIGDCVWSLLLDGQTPDVVEPIPKVPEECPINGVHQDSLCAPASHDPAADCDVDIVAVVHC